MIYKRKLLNDEQLAEIQSLIPRLEWIDGLLSTENTSVHIKKNQEARYCDNYKRINSIIMGALDDDRSFLRKTSARDTTSVIISKTVEGGYYHPHCDNWGNGDYSTTVFLNDTFNYEGGQLHLDTDTCKMDAGNAVTYSTGTPHCVTPVTTGERIVAVFWTSSLISDPFIRDICDNLEFALDNMESTLATTMEDAKQDPYFLVRSSLFELQRRYGRR